MIAALGICGNPLTIPNEMIMPTGEFLKAEAAKLSEILKDKVIAFLDSGKEGSY